MHTLLLKFAAPMQSWGAESKFELWRKTELFPTKSGVIGMIASAMGRKRDESVDDLNTLKIGLRIDQPGTVILDYQTVKKKKSKDKDETYITNRQYLSDAVFLVGIESDNENLLKDVSHCLQHPHFPLFLGRRSCPPSQPLVVGMRDGGLENVLQNEPWHAAEWYQRKQKHIRENEGSISLRVYTDAGKYQAGENVRIINDTPVSFNFTHRTYLPRRVKKCQDVVIHFPKDEEDENTTEPVTDVTDHNFFDSIAD